MSICSQEITAQKGLYYLRLGNRWGFVCPAFRPQSNYLSCLSSHSSCLLQFDYETSFASGQKLFNQSPVASDKIVLCLKNDCLGTYWCKYFLFSWSHTSVHLIAPGLWYVLWIRFYHHLILQRDLGQQRYDQKLCFEYSFFWYSKKCENFILI